MSAGSPYQCATCARLLFPSQDWRAAGCPVEFMTGCPECGTSYRLLCRLLPQFHVLPESTRFDWHNALANSLFNCHQAAAKKEADLLGLAPALWANLNPTEKRLWLTTYRLYLSHAVV